jgi:DNA-binding NarL/FixJ family response regulator
MPRKHKRKYVKKIMYPYDLTRREFKMVELAVTEGLDGKELAVRMGVGYGTIRFYICDTNLKLGTDSLYKIVHFAIFKGLILKYLIPVERKSLS